MPVHWRRGVCRTKGIASVDDMPVMTAMLTTVVRVGLREMRTSKLHRLELEQIACVTTLRDVELVRFVEMEETSAE